MVYTLYAITDLHIYIIYSHDMIREGIDDVVNTYPVPSSQFGLFCFGFRNIQLTHSELMNKKLTEVKHEPFLSTTTLYCIHLLN